MYFPHMLQANSVPQWPSTFLTNCVHVDCIMGLYGFGLFICFAVAQRFLMSCIFASISDLQYTEYAWQSSSVTGFSHPLCSCTDSHSFLYFWLYSFDCNMLIDVSSVQDQTFVTYSLGFNCGCWTISISKQTTGEIHVPLSNAEPFFKTIHFSRVA